MINIESNQQIKIQINSTDYLSKMSECKCPNSKNVNANVLDRRDR